MSPWFPHTAWFILPNLFLRIVDQAFGLGHSVEVALSFLAVAVRGGVLVWLWRHRVAPDGPGRIGFRLPRWARIMLWSLLALFLVFELFMWISSFAVTDGLSSVKEGTLNVFVVAGWPAVAFLGGTLLAHGPADPARDPREQNDAPTNDAAQQGSLPASAAASRPAAPASRPVLAVPPTDRLPTALVDHARKVAAEHHTRTGAPIDTDTLRARLGVPATLAEAIAAQLT